ncbi:MAG: CcoQ/FixQ family Cbb3-type cytochrome c oxidase assembly chaperone [Brumimicrobium sp.]|nr:CcoQ/FixQ family Cbb3-type cytochrome c oxidase assembly chaperone [Brumimicrobium sp.]
MLRYIKHNMSEIAGIEIYPIISLLIFVIFFGVMLWLTLRIPRSDIKNFRNIPLEEAEEVEENKEKEEENKSE